ncbi:hypothetical protein LINGRAHAP2_LOCUS1688 [Linum grandiflorum]
MRPMNLSRVKLVFMPIPLRFICQICTSSPILMRS